MVEWSGSRSVRHPLALTQTGHSSFTCREPKRMTRAPSDQSGTGSLRPRCCRCSPRSFYPDNYSASVPSPAFRTWKTGTGSRQPASCLCASSGSWERQESGWGHGTGLVWHRQSFRRLQLKPYVIVGPSYRRAVRWAGNELDCACRVESVCRSRRPRSSRGGIP